MKLDVVFHQLLVKNDNQETVKTESENKTKYSPQIECNLAAVVGLACLFDPDGCTDWRFISLGFNLVREAEG